MSIYPNFLKKVREGRVVSPTSRAFSPGEWTSQRAEYPVEPDDDKIYKAGLQIHKELATRWNRIEELGFPILDSAFTYALIAMIANKEEIQISRRLKEAISATGREIPFFGMTALRFSDGRGGIATADMRRTSLIDTLGKAVATAGTAFKPHDQPPFGVDEMKEILDNFSDIYLLEFLWGRVLWYGWSLEGEGAPYRFVAARPDQIAGSIVVADWRREQLAAEFIATYEMEWSSPNSILRPCWEVRARAIPGALAFRVRRVKPGQGRLSQVAVTLEILEEDELGPYLDQPLPLVGGEELVSLRDVVEGWELLFLAASDAKRLMLEAPERGGADRLSLKLPLNTLIDLLSNLQWSRRKCLAVLDFLTFQDGSKDGVWTKPLLRCGTRRLMLLTPLVSCNLLRVAELWAAEGAGEVFFAARGKEFEARLRALLAKSLVQRPWSNEAIVIETEWKPRIDKVRRDIDLAFRIGDVVFIGEIKIKRYPNSAAEVGRYLCEFEKAAKQLDVRISYLRQNLAEAAERTSYRGDPAHLRIAGFILSGTTFGSGLLVGGYPVVDRDAVEFFFRNDAFLSLATINRDSLYEGRAMASETSIELVDDDPATCMLGYLLDPLHVRHAEQGLRLIERHNRLKVTGEMLSWPEAYVEPSRSDVEAARAMTAYLSAVKADAQRRAREQLAVPSSLVVAEPHSSP